MNKLIQSTIIILGLLTAAVTFVQANNELDTVEKTETITLGAVTSKYPEAIASEVARGHVTMYQETYTRQYYGDSFIEFRPLNDREPIVLKTELLTKEQKQILRDAYKSNGEIILRFIEVSHQATIVRKDFPDYRTETQYSATDILEESPLETSVMKQTMEKGYQAFTTSMQGRILQVRRSDSDFVISPTVVCNLSVYNAETQEQKNINIASESMCSYAEQAILANKGFADIEYTDNALSSIMGISERMYYSLFGSGGYLLSISSKDAASIAPFHH